MVGCVGLVCNSGCWFNGYVVNVGFVASPDAHVTIGEFTEVKSFAVFQVILQGHQSFPLDGHPVVGQMKEKLLARLVLSVIEAVKLERFTLTMRPGLVKVPK